MKSVARTIDNTVQRQGDFVARFGGEEFVVLLSNSTEKGAAELAEKIRKGIENETIDNGEALTRVTVSLGVASMISTENMSPQDLIHAADCALYKAKNDGRNRVVLASSLPEYSSEKVLV